MTKNGAPDERFEKLLCEVLHLYWQTDYLTASQISEVLNKCGFSQELEDFIFEMADCPPLFYRLFRFLRE